MRSGCSAILDRFISIPFSDVVQGPGHLGLPLPVRRCCGEKGELGGGRREILEPDPHEPDTHPALTGLEEDLLQRAIEIKIPEAPMGEMGLACDFHLVRISKCQASLVGNEGPAPESTGASFYQPVKDSQQYPVIILVSGKGDLLGDRGPDARRIDRSRVYAEGPLMDDIGLPAKDNSQAPHIHDGYLSD